MYAVIQMSFHVKSKSFSLNHQLRVHWSCTWSFKLYISPQILFSFSPDSVNVCWYCLIRCCHSTVIASAGLVSCCFVIAEQHPIIFWKGQLLTSASSPSGLHASSQTAWRWLHSGPSAGRWDVLPDPRDPGASWRLPGAGCQLRRPVAWQADCWTPPHPISE